MNRQPHTILAIDTSTRWTGLALYDGVHVLGEALWHSQEHQTAELAPAVLRLIDQCGVELDSLACLAVALGPGSFTGLRIGLALAKGFCLARGLPLVGIPTLDILAVAQPPAALPLAAVLRAGRGRLAVGWYQYGAISGHARWQVQGEIEVLTPDELGQRIQAPTLVCGELDDEERRLLGRKNKQIMLASPAQAVRRPGFLAELGWQRWQRDELDDIASLAPFYLHYNSPIPV